MRPGAPLELPSSREESIRAVAPYARIAALEAALGAVLTLADYGESTSPATSRDEVLFRSIRSIIHRTGVG